MNKKKYIVSGVGILVSAIAIWYFFVKEYDYQIRFEKKTSPGTIFGHISKWTKTMSRSSDISILNTVATPYAHRKFDLKLKDSTLTMDWKIESTSDSTSRITVKIKDEEHRYATRLKNLITDTPLKKILLSQTSSFNTSLNDLLERHKVKIIGEADIPKRYYAYVSSKSAIDQKANTIIKLNIDILYWLKKHHIQITGRPALVTTSWEIPQDSISFDFMFPIQQRDSLPFHESIKYRTHGGGKGIKAIFNGNYRISDRAWFSLYEYAKRNTIKIETLPIEYFYNDPLEGSRDIEWKTEIYMPLKTSNE